MSAIFTSSCESQECDFCGAVVGQCCRHCTAHEAKDDDQ